MYKALSRTTSLNFPLMSYNLTLAFPLPRHTFALLPSANSMKWLLALNLSSKSTNFSRSTIMWLVAPESNSRFGVVLPLVLNSCSLKVNAKLCELVMFSSFSADFNSLLRLWQASVFYSPLYCGRSSCICDITLALWSSSPCFYALSCRI